MDETVREWFLYQAWLAAKQQLPDEPYDPRSDPSVMNYCGRSLALVVHVLELVAQGHAKPLDL